MLRLAVGLVASVVLLAPIAAGAAGWDAAGWDASGWDASGWDASGWDASGWDASGWDASGWDASGWDASGWDASGWDASGWDASGWDASGWDGSGWDAPTWNGGQWNGGTWHGAPFPIWGFVAIDPPAAWSPVAPPTSRLACMIDSGADVTHPALAPYVAHTRSFIDATVADPAGHGTHLAGLVVATGAPRLAIAKVLDETGRGETADVVAALEWCASLGSDVILLALSEDAPTKEFERAVERAARHAVVVASAGNRGPCERCLGSPASIPHVLAVGAVDPDIAPAPFSSTGPLLDLYAPGAFIVSTYPGGAWRVGSGTSQAAAFVAGAAAYVWDAHPDWNAQQVRNALTLSARPLDGERAGLLDLSDAAAWQPR